ncbi:MAG TPA: glycogen debranching protein GlgX [Clostridia bacterium]|nr:glycogen debranching protein GlgX [Clostridia bacterium]
MSVWAGLPYPLGATFDGFGTNFSVFSEVAEEVELCLFDPNGREHRIRMPEVTGYVWHCYLPQVEPGQPYGYRVHGPWDPASGARCLPDKLLLDPYAKAIEGEVTWDEAVFPYRFDDPDGAPNTVDSASFVPRSVVVDPAFDWGIDRPLRRPDNDTVIYEVHVKGFTARHPRIPEALRGTYAGLAHPVAIEHFQKLGVTAVELLPVHQFVHDAHLVERGLRNYWGYNSIGFLAPHNEYASSHGGGQVQEFKQMVKDLHAAGIEVLLDVVYNHTAEGNHLGPLLSMKGIDNAAYYRLMEDDRRYYMDYTGTGNTLNVRHPQTLQLIMDSLRYWIIDMHVDGFRFDLAAALARELHEVDRLSAFFDLIHQDPTVSQVKLIAEPWDVGEGGYQVGNFPVAWSEWNGRYRDTMRDVWRGEPQSLGEFASRLSGSSDLYETTGRRPYASINFITAHDGFTLADLVSYNEKHNDGNGEENRDGESHNRSWNHGAEGPTDDLGILTERHRHQRNLLATLFLSQGVPMLLGGDEIGRTQQGNNNGYCQDNELSWLDWEAADEELLAFVQQLIAFRHAHPAFHRRRWFLGRSVRPSATHDIEWFRPDGSEMADDDWSDALIGGLGVYLSGEGLVDLHGEPLRDDTFFLAFNTQAAQVDFCAPNSDHGGRWRVVLDTAADDPFPADGAEVEAGTTIPVEARSIVVLERLPAGTPVEP